MFLEKTRLDLVFLLRMSSFQHKNQQKPLVIYIFVFLADVASIFTISTFQEAIGLILRSSAEFYNDVFPYFLWCQVPVIPSQQVASRNPRTDDVNFLLFCKSLVGVTQRPLPLEHPPETNNCQSSTKPSKVNFWYSSAIGGASTPKHLVFTIFGKCAARKGQHVSSSGAHVRACSRRGIRLHHRSGRKFF